MTAHRVQGLSALRPRSAKATGYVVLAALMVVAVFAFDHPRILATLTPGEHIAAEFSRTRAM